LRNLLTTRAAAGKAKRRAPRRFAPVLLIALQAGCSFGTTSSRGHADESPYTAAMRASAPETPLVVSQGKPASPVGIDWVFVQVEGYAGHLPSPPPVAGFIMTPQGGILTGTTACNRMSSGYQLDVPGGHLRFTNLRNTRMLCDRVASDTEEAVLQAMIATDGFRIENGMLELTSHGHVIARLKAGNR
jgi:heat shock protein HslJ